MAFVSTDLLTLTIFCPADVVFVYNIKQIAIELKLYSLECAPVILVLSFQVRLYRFCSEPLVATPAESLNSQRSLVLLSVSQHCH